VLDEAQASVAGALVLDRHAAHLHHHLPQLLGRAPGLLGPRQLLAGGGQQLTQLPGGSEVGREGGRERAVIG